MVCSELFEIAVIGRYWTVTAMLSTINVQPEPGLPAFPLPR
ncbi:hypothetical protein [Actinomadura sp. 3N508]